MTPSKQSLKKVETLLISDDKNNEDEFKLETDDSDKFGALNNNNFNSSMNSNPNVISK
jgi:hypothetical protein